MDPKLVSLIEKLKEQNIEHRVVEMAKPAVTSEDVVTNKVDVNPDQIVKTIMFKKKNGDTFCVSVCKKDRIDYKKLRAVVGGKISTLSPDSMRELNWEPGECCPLSVPGPLYVDPTVFDHELINTGSGDLMYGLEFKPEVIKQFRDDVEVLDVRE